MRANRRVDTGPELSLRSELHRRGLRFRKDFPVQVTGGWVRPDVVFPRQRVAIFIDGCFWHRCPEHGRLPKRNRDYWEPKLSRNVERDGLQTDRLKAAGWVVLRFFEHVPEAIAAQKVEEIVRERQAG
jgi:DNA mismatch endonuclease, patch repair protein